MDVVRGTAGMPAGVCVGVGATLVMDACLVLASRLAPDVLATEKLNVNLIGRWVAGLGRGPRQGEDITMAPAVPGEVALGLATHYATGIALTQVYLASLDRLGVPSSLGRATAFGVATAALPLWVMFPSVGYGVGGRQSTDGRRMRSVMLLGQARSVPGSGCARPLTRPRG